MAKEVNSKSKKELFEKFGEFDSAEEINKTASGLLEEGDEDNIYILASENGIDKEDAEDYINGDMTELVSVMGAAFGKIAVEEKYYENKDNMTKAIMNVIFTMLKRMCQRDDMAAAVRKKGMRADKILKAIRSGAQRHKSGSTGVSCGTDKQLMDIIECYYLKNDEKLLDVAIEALYK